VPATGACPEDSLVSTRQPDKKKACNGNLLVENRHGLIVNTEVLEANGNSRMRCRAGDAETDSGHETGAIVSSLPENPAATMFPSLCLRPVIRTLSNLGR
jgi:hypothetical protein